MSALARLIQRAVGTPSAGNMGDYPPCDCGHSSPRHHGDDRSGSPLVRASACKDCTWCDYYKPTYRGPAYEAWLAARTSSDTRQENNR